MSELRAWAIDISLVTDVAADAVGPLQLSLPASLHLEDRSLVALMDMGRCCGLGMVRDETLVILPVSFEPNLLVSPQYEPTELHAEDRAKLFGGDESHLRRVLGSISVSPTAHAVEAAPRRSDRTYRLTTPPSNVILYGPPGTGKTHSVRGRALELLGVPSASTATAEDLRTEWERLRREGRIVFCTFHQAFAYEEFVEGLRAETDDDGGVHYRVEPGVFKRLALTAAAEGLVSSDTDANLPFDIRWSTLLAQLQTQARTMSGKSADSTYQLTVSSHGNINAVPGTVQKVGDEESFTPSNATALVASRQVMERIWAAREELGENPTTTKLREFGNGTALWLAYKALQELKFDSSLASDPITLVEQALVTGAAFDFARPDVRHYVLVIDEINRANMARVFGELITLLEPDKRIGCSNAHIVELPGSKLPFGVPPNLHVIGTMNTADRSIALMDVALRRRFTFEEMMPDARIIRSALENATDDDGRPVHVPAPLVQLVVDVFNKLNSRLRFLYDREHQIGHAYFLGVRTLGDLRQVFADRILPLLQEYFFGQWDKVALVLGYPLKSEGTPRDRDLRGQECPIGTLLIAQKVAEKQVLGFDHDDYVDQVAWDVHPVFRSRGPAPKSDHWLAEAFFEVAGADDRSGAATQLVASLSGAEES